MSDNELVMGVRTITVKGNIRRLYNYIQMSRSYSFEFPDIDEATLDASEPVTFRIFAFSEEDVAEWVDKVLPRFEAEVVSVEQ